MSILMLRRIEDLARILAYSCIVASGIGVLAFPLESYGGVSDVLMTGWGVLQVSGVLGVVAVALRRPIMEWRVLVFMTAGVACYAFISWTAVLGQAPSHLGRAADITALALLLVSRFLGQWTRVEEAEQTAAALDEYEGDGAV